MRLAGIRRGDIVRVAGDDSALWTVLGKEGRGLRVMIHGRPLTERTVGSRDVAEAWRKVRPKKATEGTP